MKPLRPNEQNGIDQADLYIIALIGLPGAPGEPLPTVNDLRIDVVIRRKKNGEATERNI